MALIESYKKGGSSSDFKIINAISATSFTAEKSSNYAVIWSGSGNPATMTITTNGDFICGLKSGVEITNFVSPYTASDSNNSGAVVILHLDAGETLSITAGCIIELGNLSGTVVPNNHVATGDEMLVVNARTYDNNSHTISADNNREYTFTATTIKYKDLGALSYSNSSVTCCYNVSAGDTIPTYQSGYTYGTIKIA